MNRRSIIQRALLTAFATFFAVAAFAQPADRVTKLAERLDLTEQQVQIVQQHLSDRTPGTSWQLAAALTPTLTEAQKEKLFARPERAQRPELQRGEARGERPDRQRGEARGERRRQQRATDGQRPDAQQMRARMADRHEARNEALGLTDTQVQQLEAVMQEHRDAMTERRQALQQGDRRMAAQHQRRGLPAEVAQILSAEQQEIWQVHNALARHAVVSQARGMRR